MSEVYAFLFFFFCKQKTAYEMRISDWSSDVCSSDLIYGLVNNAAIGLDGVLGTMHNSDIERALRINTLAPIVLTKYVSRSMMLNRRGRVINISSIIATTGFSGLAACAASKAALEGFTRSLARELGRMNITRTEEHTAE